MKTWAKILCTLTVALIATQSGISQTVLGNEPLDGVYQEVHNPHRRVVPFANVREADAMWVKRVWRNIDLREKINLQLYYPVSPNANRKSLFDVFSKAALAGELKAYDFNVFDQDDTWSLPLTIKEITDKLVTHDTATDENGERTPITNKVTSQSIRQYELKEDWFFDKERSVLDVRILGICPKKLTINDNTHKEDENAPPTATFWLYYPELRPFLAGQTIFNPHNDAERRTLDDILMKRQFSSFIVEESNVYGRTISDYTKGLDALLEGEKIHQNVFGIEHDMWQY